jgi:hypothetical protein
MRHNAGTGLQLGAQLRPKLEIDRIPQVNGDDGGVVKVSFEQILLTKVHAIPPGRRLFSQERSPPADASRIETDANAARRSEF